MPDRIMSDGIENISIQLKVNGKSYSRTVEPRKLLVELLREDLDLTGTHVGCDTTYCGACTVLMNGAAVKSCTMFAVQADGAEILTVEGLEKDGELHPSKRPLAIATDCSADTARRGLCCLPCNCYRGTRSQPTKKCAKRSQATPAAVLDTRIF